MVPLVTIVTGAGCATCGCDSPRAERESPGRAEERWASCGAEAGPSRARRGRRRGEGDVRNRTKAPAASRKLHGAPLPAPSPRKRKQARAPGPAAATMPKRKKPTPRPPPPQVPEREEAGDEGDGRPAGEEPGAAPAARGLGGRRGRRAGPACSARTPSLRPTATCRRPGGARALECGPWRGRGRAGCVCGAGARNPSAASPGRASPLWGSRKLAEEEHIEGVQTPRAAANSRVYWSD